MKNLRFPSLIAALSLIILSGGCKDKSSSGLFLPRSTPEAEGVSSAALITFLDSVEADRHEFHSIMIVRHGKVVAEGWWDPYKPDLRHTLTLPARASHPPP
jgi:hypothetical protein